MYTFKNAVEENRNIIVNDMQNTIEKIREISQVSSKKKIIISDFDGTMTFAYGKERAYMTTFGTAKLHLGKEHENESVELYNRYHIYEHNDKISRKRKGELMGEWCRRSLNLMLKHGFSRNIIETIVRDNNLRPRKSLGSFIKKMKRLDIPIWVLSSGVGDIIQRFFEEYYDIDNLKIHSNFLDYDKHGIAIAFNADKCVYNHTKKESLFKRDDFKREKEKRPYQIVLGDSVDDVKVVEDHTKSLTIGFVDDDINNRVKIFRKHFDLILCNCQPMDFINDYLVEDVI